MVSFNQLLYPQWGDMMYRPKDTKERIIHRLKIAQGHLNKVLSMVEQDEYCIDVIHQSLAVQAALKTIDQVVLKNHMQTCVADSIKKGQTKEVVDEVMKVIEKT